MAQLLQTPPLTVFEHMALDETLAQSGGSVPLLRFYEWTAGPAVTFGYSQFYHFVRQQTRAEQGPLCRRPTGGGLVFHGEDLTFSLIFQSRLSPKEIYRQLHSALEQALAASGALVSSRQGAVAAAQYAPQQNGQASGCFANPVQDDLLSGGHKVLGGAIRRFGEMILYQGSLQCPHARQNPLFRQAITLGVQHWWGQTLEMENVPADVLTHARQLAVTQYTQAAWTEKL